MAESLANSIVNIFGTDGGALDITYLYFAFHFFQFWNFVEDLLQHTS